MAGRVAVFGTHSGCEKELCLFSSVIYRAVMFEANFGYKSNGRRPWPIEFKE